MLRSGFRFKLHKLYTAEFGTSIPNHSWPTKLKKKELVNMNQELEVAIEVIFYKIIFTFTLCFLFSKDWSPFSVTSDNPEHTQQKD